MCGRSTVNRATELVLGNEKPQEKILDVLGRPEHYAADRAGRSGEDFGRRHSPEARLRELIQIIQE